MNGNIIFLISDQAMSSKPYHNGWFIIHRDLFVDPAFKQTEVFSEIEAYIWLLSQAVFDKCVINIAGKPIQLVRGQLSYSHRFLAELWGWSDSTTYRYLKKMVVWHKIETRIETGQFIITICNYDDLQRPSTQVETGLKQEKNQHETNKKKSNHFKQEIKDPPYNPPFRIEDFLSEEARLEIPSISPGWDKYVLMEKYDEQINSGKFERPKNPSEAFLGFCRKFTKGRPPS